MTSSDLPLYRTVPKSFDDNLAYRAEVWDRSSSDRKYQAALWKACSRDLLFYVNTFCWTYDPRKISDGKSPKLPFITWEYQDDCLYAMNERIGKSDVLIEKSRDMGASWLCLTLFHWRWMFKPLESYLMVSRKESLVDGSGDSLFAHIDFLLKGLPLWMIPKHRRNKLKLMNLDNGTKLEGESTTDNIGRGGRRTAMLIDEFAAFEQGGWDVLSATADNTNCRLFNSTPAGTGNAFYAQREKGTARLRMHWTLHPEKGADQYVDEDGKPRSPWYDGEVLRRASSVEIATQLDIDYQGSDYPFFDPDTLRRLIDDYSSGPKYQGTLMADAFGEPEFVNDGEGFLKVWCDLDDEMRPRSDRDYVIGVDVSQGTQASDTVFSVGDRMSGEKVAEWADNRTPTYRAAEICVALANMFKADGGRGAYIIWEATGPGRTFGHAIMDEMRYGNVYFHTDEQRLNGKMSDKPGWFSTQEGKKDLLAQYRHLLFNHQFINPSEQALIEASEYVFLANGKIEHSGSVYSIDPSNRGSGHGDRVIADALCAKILGQTKIGLKEKPVEGPAIGSMAWRRSGRREALDEHEVWEGWREY